MAPTTQLVLGVDPGSRVAGWALVGLERGALVEARAGTWRLAAGRTRAQRLAELVCSIEETLVDARPDVAAVEGLFTHRNVRSAMVLAEARGAILATLGRLEIPVVEYPPATVKLTICGHGSATKEIMRRALARSIEGLDPRAVEGLAADASDALALALCHTIHARVEARTGARSW